MNSLLERVILRERLAIGWRPGAINRWGDTPEDIQERQRALARTWR